MSSGIIREGSAVSAVTLPDVEVTDSSAYAVSDEVSKLTAFEEFVSALCAAGEVSLEVSVTGVSCLKIRTKLPMIIIKWSEHIHAIRGTLLSLPPRFFIGAPQYGQNKAVSTTVSPHTLQRICILAVSF